MFHLSVFGGVDLSVPGWQPGREVSSVTLFGDTTVDFSVASFDEPRVRVMCMSLFGDTTLVVPEDVGIKVSTMKLAGDVKRPTVPDVQPGDDGRFLEVTILSLVGDINLVRPSGES